MTFRLKWLFILLIMPWTLFSEKYAADFLNIGIGARALGMGGAFCSLANDGTAFYWNPAGLGYVDKMEINAMYGPQFGSLANPLANFHYLGVTHNLPGAAVISVNWIRLSVDDIPIYGDLQGESYWDRLHHAYLRPEGTPQGYFSDTEDAIYFSFALMNRPNIDLGWGYYRFPMEIPIGFNLKILRQQLGDGEATGMGIDIGTMFRFSLNDVTDSQRLGRVGIGLMLQDLTGTRLTWNTEHQDELPINFKWGLSYSQPLPKIKSQLAIAYNHDSRWRGRHRWGMEFTGFQLFHLRTGLDDGQFTGGFGIHVWKFQVDYAFLSHSLDHLHRISCQIKI